MTPLDDTDDAPTAGIEQIAVEHTKKNQTQWRPLIGIATFAFCTWLFAPQVGTENYWITVYGIAFGHSGSDLIGAVLRDMTVPFVTTGAVYLALPHVRQA